MGTLCTISHGTDHSHISNIHIPNCTIVITDSNIATITTSRGNIPIIVPTYKIRNTNHTIEGTDGTKFCQWIIAIGSIVYQNGTNTIVSGGCITVRMEDGHGTITRSSTGTVRYQSTTIGIYHLATRIDII